MLSYIMIDDYHLLLYSNYIDMYMNRISSSIMVYLLYIVQFDYDNRYIHPFIHYFLYIYIDVTRIVFVCYLKICNHLMNHLFTPNIFNTLRSSFFLFTFDRSTGKK